MNFNPVDMEQIKNFWLTQRDFIQYEPIDSFIKSCKNPRYVEFPFQYHCYESKRPKRVLECGSSHIDRNFFKIYWELILNKSEPFGIDITALREDRYGQSITPEEIKKFKTFVTDIRKTNFEDGFFDMIFCISTLEHVGFEVGKVSTKESPNSIVRLSDYPTDPNDHKGDFDGLKELKRITNKNGSIVLTVPFENKARYIKQTDSMGFVATEIAYDEARLKNMLSYTGMKIDEYVNYFEDETGWKSTKEMKIPSEAKQGVSCLLLRYA